MFLHIKTTWQPLNWMLLQFNGIIDGQLDDGTHMSVTPNLPQNGRQS